MVQSAPIPSVGEYVGVKRSGIGQTTADHKRSAFHIFHRAGVLRCWWRRRVVDPFAVGVISTHFFLAQTYNEMFTMHAHQ